MQENLSGFTIRCLNQLKSNSLFSLYGLDGIFISIGRDPFSRLFEGQLPLDSSGYIVSDESTKTAIDGVFAVGDVRTKAFRQVVTAVSDGATAIHFAEEYLETLEK